MFSTIARLTKSNSFIEPILADLNSVDFMSFFTNKITKVGEIIVQGRSMTPDALPLLVTLPGPNPPLDSFLPIDLPELTSTIKRCKPTTCLLDPIPTKLFKDVFPLLGAIVLDKVNLLLATGYVPQVFKTAVIRSLLENRHLTQAS